MTATFRFGVLTAAALIGAAGCTGSINGQTGSGSGNGGSSNTGSGGSSNTGNGGSSNTGNGGSSNTGNGGSSTTGSGGNGTACVPLPALPRRLWRLSVEQWGAAVQTLLGLKTAPVLTSRGGEQPFAFFSDSTLGVDNQMQFEMYTQAEAVLTTIDGSVMTMAPCSGTTAAAQTTCANTFVSSFAQKAYRRPLDTSEVTNLMKVYAQGAMQDYKTGIKLMIEAVIISPSFIYRTELGPTATADSSGKYPDTTMTPYEVASQLGFTLLGTLPDADAADGGYQRQPRHDGGHLDPDRSAARAAGGSGESDQHRARLVQHQPALLEDQGHGADLQAADRGTRPDGNRERPVYRHPDVRQQRALERVREDRRPDDFADGLCQPAARHVVSRTFRSPRQGADQRYDVRGGNLGGLRRSQRHAHSAGLSVVGVGPDAQFDREARQGHPRQRDVPGLRSVRRWTCRRRRRWRSSLARIPASPAPRRTRPATARFCCPTRA